MIEIILFAFFVYLMCKLPEWISNNRTSPPGYHKDWDKSNYDIVTKGKDFYHRQNLSGEYDIPNKK